MRRNCTRTAHSDHAVANFKPCHSRFKTACPNISSATPSHFNHSLVTFGRFPNTLFLRASSSQQTTTSVTVTNATERSLPTGFEIYSSDRRWRVRQVDPTNKQEIQAIVQLQTEGFHTPNPIPLLDDTFKNFFKAEVVSEMNKKLKYNPADRFVCLVVEERNGSVPIGVVEVSYIDVKEILKSLEPGTEGFVYIASMAVDTEYRRRGVASALLKGAENVAKRWDEKQALLHVYQDNVPAVELYKNREYEIIYQDAPWLAKLAVRPRYLMRKKW